MIVPLPPPADLSAGIILNDFICAVIALASAAFCIFLLRRWSKLNALMKTYTYFWMAAFLTWVGITIRYFMYLVGVEEEAWYWANERFLQIAIYGSGIPLLIYLALLLFKKRWIIWLFAAEGVIGFIAAVWFLFLPTGYGPAELTDFTVDPLVNSSSILIFDILAGTVLVLLLTHIGKSLYQKFFVDHQPLPFTVWYSLSLLVYVGIGSIDQIKVITGWPIVAFRVLYAAAFLFAYLITVSDEERSEEYLQVSRSNQAP
jgi:hypothetical protein